MSRRADPENIYLARCAAVLSILTTSGVSVGSAEVLVREWEADAEARGIPRLGLTFWDGAAEWTNAPGAPRTRRGPPALPMAPIESQ